MTDKKVYTVTDLGGGDGGKGSIIHKICTLRKPHTIIKVGGAQGSHGIETDFGEKFAFSQFGCGTFNGADTFISNRFVFSPIGILKEAETLRYEYGISDPFALLTIDDQSLCTTPYHGIASRLKELARGENPQGTVGVGVGEAFSDVERYPDEVMRAFDFQKSDDHIRKKVTAIRDRKIFDLDPVMSMDFLVSDQAEMQKEINLLYDNAFLEWIIEQFLVFKKQVTIVDDTYLKQAVLSRDGIAIVESSHGILTDHFYGFHPHTSRLRTLPEITSWSLLHENDYSGEVVKIGVTRGYQIRHGAGPLVVDDQAMADSLLAEEVNKPDRYRGKVRVGPLDLVALRYALNVCGGPRSFDALAITWMDHVFKNNTWKICNRYKNSDNSDFFTPEGDIQVTHGIDNQQLMRQQKLTAELQNCRPVITEYAVNSQESTTTLCQDVLAEKLGLPVRMISYGPTESDKILC